MKNKKSGEFSPLSP